MKRPLAPEALYSNESYELHNPPAGSLSFADSMGRMRQPSFNDRALALLAEIDSQQNGSRPE